MSSIDHQEVEPEERESAWEDTEEEIDESDSIWEDAEEEIEDTDSVWEDTDEEIDEDDAAQPQLTMIDLSRSWFSPIIPLNNVKSNCNLPAMSRLAPPVNLDVGSCLAGFQLSLVEIITFLPLHMQWPAFAARCSSAEWTAVSIAKLIFYSRNLDKNNYSKDFHQLRNTIQKRVDHAKQNVASGKASPFDATTSMWVEPSTLSWQGYRELLPDCFLLNLARGIQVLPSGADRGPLTMVIEHMLAHGNLDVKATQIGPYIADQNLATPSTNFDTSHDKAALGRLQATWGQLHPRKRRRG